MARMWAFSAVIAAAAALLILRYCGVLGHWLSENPIASPVLSFQEGLLFSGAVLSLFWLARYARAVRSEEKLRLLYNKEHDERGVLIRQKAGMPMLMITSGLMLFAGIIAGYFNETVFFTLILCATAQLTVGACVKIYYLRKV